MRLLTIDLGDTTGYCWFTDDKMTDHGALKLADVVPTIKPYRLEFDKVVLEAPALVQTGKNGRGYADVVAKFSIMFEKKLTVVRPTDWKQRYDTFPLPGRGVLKTQHEKDAYRIGAWFLKLAI